MIVVDTSALIAILTDEDDAAVYSKAIAEADTALLSAATQIEAGIVMLNRHGERGNWKLENLIQVAGLRVESVAARHVQLALDAYSRFGKGQGHPAGLNYGDCFSYALAKATGLPLLFKGADFSRTDLAPALPRPN